MAYCCVIADYLDYNCTGSRAGSRSRAAGAAACSAVGFMIRLWALLPWQGRWIPVLTTRVTWPAAGAFPALCFPWHHHLAISDLACEIHLAARQSLFCLTQKIIKVYLVILCVLSSKSHFSSSLFKVLEFCLTWWQFLSGKSFPVTHCFRTHILVNEISYWRYLVPRWTTAEQIPSKLYSLLLYCSFVFKSSMAPEPAGQFDLPLCNRVDFCSLNTNFLGNLLKIVIFSL